MQVTDIKMRKVLQTGKMKTVVSVTFDDAFVVHDIKVIEGNDKLFVAMPSKRTADGTYRDIVHPITSAMREELQSLILAKYEELMKNESSQEDVR